MFGLFSKTPPPAPIPELLYRAVVAKSRQPIFYRELGVPDTIDGRFDLIVLHLVLLLARLAAEGEIGDALGQEIFDGFIRDMDRSLREMGVGDLGLKRRMKRMVESFYGRASAYSEPLANGDADALARALDRNFFPEGSQPRSARALAGYAVAARGVLRGLSRDELLGGQMVFADAEPSLAAGSAR